MNNPELPTSLSPKPSASVAPASTPRSGKIGWALMWLLGIPLPILLIIYLIVR